MKKVEVVLKGTSPLLMHSAQGMTQETLKKNPTKNYDNVEQAESVAYRTKKGDLYVPARCLKAAILNAASWYKFGKISAKPLLAGMTRVTPVDLLLYDEKGKKVLKDYEIDLRPVVIQKSRIIRARPRLDEWVLKFDLLYNDEAIGGTVGLDKIRQIIEEAGQRIGILDNRPHKSYGENGTFEVITFKPKK